MKTQIGIIPATLAMVVSLMSAPAGAANSVIDTSGAEAFLYGGRSYVPLKSTANFLGAPLRWDAATGQSVLTYKGVDLALKQNSVKALLGGRGIELPSPPVSVGGVTYVPTEVLSRFAKVPIAWDGARSEVKLKGPHGWGTMRANSHPSWGGGPPPWAPAWGQRRNAQQGSSYAAKPRGNKDNRGWDRDGKAAPGNSGNVKPNGHGKAQGWDRRGNAAQGNSGNVKPNRHGKAQGWGRNGNGAPGNGKQDGKRKHTGNGNDRQEGAQ